MKYAVPMYESERGWGAKIDGYAGPFDSEEAASAFRSAYNTKNNNLVEAPDWYIAALSPVAWDGKTCDYKSTVE